MKWTIDNGGRRSGIDRRQFPGAHYNPEKRSGKDRRSGIDRRNGIGFKIEGPREKREIYKS